MKVLHALLPQITPLLLFIILGLLIYHTTRPAPSPALNTQEPNLDELEEKLNQLLMQNRQDEKIEALHQELKSSKSNIIASYVQLNKKDLKGYHLFQLILSLIKNQAEDTKIIKILHHYLPSCATAHLYAMLKAYKKFLNLSKQDHCQKELLRDLNQNRLRSTLIYLETKLNQAINQVPLVPPALQQQLINQAMIYGLIFASFSQFYNSSATQKILRLVASLTPELFQYWHLLPQKKSLKKSSPSCFALPSKDKKTRT